MLQMAARRAAGLVIYRARDQSSVTEWLLLQTSYGQHHWTPPKGHLDPGEDDITAAMRETREEAGLGAEQLTVFHDIKEELSYEAFGKPKIVTYWLAKLNSYEDKIILSDEHQDFKWLSLEKAVELSGFPDMAQCFKTFDEKLKNSL